jgi:hypothetical protein
MAALLPLALAAGCMSAGKRYEHSLRRDPSLADARARLQETGARAVDQYLAESGAAASAGAHDDAAETLLQMDVLRRDAAAVGVELAVPADYAQHRRAVLDAAIDDAVDRGESMAQGGRYSDALGRLERVSRWQPNAEQRRRVDEARVDTYALWMGAEAAQGRHRSAYNVAERAIAALGRQLPGMERLIEAQQYAVDEGTVRVAVLPVTASRHADRLLGASFLRDTENDLESGAWTRPPMFVEIVDPREVRRQARRYDGDDLQRTSEALRLGRAVGADMVVMVEIDSVSVGEVEPRSERRTARTRGGVDTAFTVVSGRRQAWARVRYSIVEANGGRMVTREWLTPEASRPFREARFTGDWRQLVLNDDDRRLFDPARRDDTPGELMELLSREMAEDLSAALFERVLREVQ